MKTARFVPDVHDPVYDVYAVDFYGAVKTTLVSRCRRCAARIHAEYEDGTGWVWVHVDSGGSK